MSRSQVIRLKRWHEGFYSTLLSLIGNTTQIDALLFTSHCLLLSSFQLKTMGFGRMVSPMNVVRCCSKPSTTCWSAASWIAALFALGNGSWNPTRRTRSLLIRGTLTELLLGSHPYGLWLMSMSCTFRMCIFMFIFLMVGILDMICVLIEAVMYVYATQASYCYKKACMYDQFLCWCII